MGRIRALWCRFCQKTTHQEQVAVDGDLRLLECRSCYARKVLDLRGDT